ncbi:hypothetical protein E3N88_06710 [Mikania micrantha]|uniref:Uncharacterized protein n=1 Tax=Mikania micrantha TaxID=192012 RepID=A0A5N6PPE8_9ASTR|nr:hypothetical protein E3N88_06710 [Mikania micrantha]
MASRFGQTKLRLRCWVRDFMQVRSKEGFLGKIRHPPRAWGSVGHGCGQGLASMPWFVAPRWFGDDAGSHAKVRPAKAPRSRDFVKKRKSYAREKMGVDVGFLVENGIGDRTGSCLNLVTKHSQGPMDMVYRNSGGTVARAVATDPYICPIYMHILVYHGCVSD